jgi:hypothetical protein
MTLLFVLMPKRTYFVYINKFVHMKQAFILNLNLNLSDSKCNKVYNKGLKFFSENVKILKENLAVIA